MQFGSPELDYFRTSGRVKPSSSRWKEDWEELELLVSYQFLVLFQRHSSVMCRGKELLGQSLKPGTKLIRESTQVSPNSLILFLFSQRII